MSGIPLLSYQTSSGCLMLGKVIALVMLILNPLFSCCTEEVSGEKTASTSRMWSKVVIKSGLTWNFSICLNETPTLWKSEFNAFKFPRSNFLHVIAVKRKC